MHSSHITSLFFSLLLGRALGGSSLDCEKIIAGGKTFNLLALGGPHSVVTSRFESIPQTHINTTYTIDICHPLQKSGDHKDAECPNGTKVCAIQRTLNGDTDTVSEVIAIAGALENHGGSRFEVEVERLKQSDSNSDFKKEGVRLVLGGGKHGGRKQSAIVEFLCDPEKEGTEGEWDSEDKYEKGQKLRRDEGDDKKDGDTPDGDDDNDPTTERQLKSDGAAMIWEGYGPSDDKDVLRLSWYTKLACEKRSDDDGGDGGDDGASSHWGFFTWFVIVVFLGIAAYLIFGSWLNYNRYGARGWDLLPHGDTIRDIPYLLKDWVRRVLNTVQGAGSRGGYSAV